MAKKNKHPNGGGPPVMASPDISQAWFVRVCNVGHGFGMRLPKPFLKAAGLQHGDVLAIVVLKPGTFWAERPPREHAAVSVAQKFVGRRHPTSVPFVYPFKAESV